jgi:hypothetical protein
LTCVCIMSTVEKQVKIAPNKKYIA